ncbi:MAG: Rrf2 family transcriptional regulator [Chitinophagales bacterium]
MIFSKACEYGIRATLYIAQRSLDGERVSLKNIANEIDSPVAFTAKILQLLAKNNIVESLKGPTGGFYIQREDIDKLKLVQIVTAIDGDAIFKGCGLGLKECNESYPCPVHDKFKAIRDDLQEMLSQTSIYELATGLEIGLTYLKR